MSTDSVELDEIHPVIPQLDDSNAKNEATAAKDDVSGGLDNNNRFSRRPKSLFASVRKKSFRKLQHQTPPQKQFTNIFPCPKSIDLTSPEFGSNSSLGIVSSLVSSPNSASMRRLRMAKRKTKSVVISNYQPNHGKITLGLIP